MIITYFKKVKQLYLEKGLACTIVIIAKKFANMAIGIFYKNICYNIAVINLSISNQFNSIEYRKNVTIREIKNEDFKLINNLFGMDLVTEFKQRLINSMCILIFKNKNLIGYTWLTNKLQINEGINPFFIDINPKEGYVYIYKTLVMQEERGKGVCKQLYQYTLYYCKRLGYKKAFLIFNNKNKAMKNVTEMLSFNILGKIKYKKYLWIKNLKTDDLEIVCLKN